MNLGLFLIALLPRGLGIGVFVTADEAKWVYRSAQFLGALLCGDLVGTVVNLTPAVTTTWLGSLGLAAYYALHRPELGTSFVEWLASMPEFRVDLDVLVAARWSMVLLTSLGVVAFYQVARGLTSRRAAILFALLLALDPHFISLSRMLGHDAPAGLFTGLSLLAFLRFLWSRIEGQRAFSFFNRGWLPISGVLAGLAWLSKSPTFFLVPFVGLVALVEALQRGAAIRLWIGRLAAWGLVAWLVFVVLWPAAWRNPAGAPYSVVYNAFLSATDTAEVEEEGYWQVPELARSYYLVNGVFKLSLLATLGLVAWAWLSVTRRHRPASFEWWLLAFAVLFTIFMTLGGKRSNRYILPAWPALYLLAAIGISEFLKWTTQWMAKGLSQTLKPNTQYKVTQYAIRNSILVLLVTLPPLLTYPYYFSYFNPLMGGALTAPRLVKIGWGEGLDQVGRWLSKQPDAPALRVGSYYGSALAPFFAGGISGVTAGGLDYVVLYRKQVQGGYPSPTILRYFEAEEPLYTVQLDGIEYARIYRGPAVQPAMANEAAFDIGILPKPLAFRLNQPYLPIGEKARVEVLWLTAQELPTAPSWLTLQAADDLTRRPEERANTVFAEAPGRLERRAGDLVVSEHWFEVPAGLPRGSYGLLVDSRPLGTAEARQFILPGLERLDANFGDQVRLAGYTFDDSTRTLSLVWQASPRAWADYTVFVHIVDAEGNRLAGADAQPPIPTSQWTRGEVVLDQRVLPMPEHPAVGSYRPVVGLYRSDTGERLPLVDAEGLPIADSLTLPFSLPTPP